MKKLNARNSFTFASVFQVLMLSIALTALSPSAHAAANYFWTGGVAATTNAPVSGPWDTSTANIWSDGTVPNGDQVWSPANNAYFVGPDGNYSITVGGNFNANNIIFMSSGYDLSAISLQTITAQASTDLYVALGKTLTIDNNVAVAATGVTTFEVEGTLNLTNGGALKMTSSNTGGVAGTNGVINVYAGSLLSGPNNGGSSGALQIGTTIGGTVTVNVIGGTLSMGTGKQPLNLGVSATAVGIVTITNGGLVLVNSGAGSGLQMGTSATGSGTINLDGGTLSTPFVKQVSGSATINFNGGLFAPSSSSAGPTCLQGTIACNVRNGGMVITNGFAVTIAPGLAHSPIGGDNAIDGGLTQMGASTLTLNGTNTYTGSTIVSNGTLVTTTASIGGGAYVVADGATLKVQINTAGTSLTNSSLTLGTSGNLTNTFALGLNASQTAPVIVDNGSLNLNGTVTVNVTGTIATPGTYPLITYGSLSGSGSFVVGGSLPSLNGYTVALTNDTLHKTLEIVYTAVPTSLQWAIGSGNWDTSSLNWQPLGGGSDTNYEDSELVTFNDSASGPSPITVTLTASRSPGGIVDNSTNISYILSDGGNGYSITGIGGLTKSGGNMLTLNVNATYAGNTVVSGGTLAITNLGSIPNSALITVGSGATLSASGRTDSTLTLNSAQTLGGNGTVVGNLTVNGGVVAPALGTFTVTGNDLWPNSGQAMFVINRTNNPNCGELIRQGSPGAINNTLIVNQGPALQLGDTFQLLNRENPSANTTAFPTLSGNLTWLNNMGTIGSITVGGPNNTYYWTGSSGSTNTPVSGTWDGTTTHWNNGTGGGVANTVWTNGGSVIFPATSSNNVVTVVGPISPYSITFNGNGTTLTASNPTIIPLEGENGVQQLTWGGGTGGNTNTIGTNVTITVGFSEVNSAGNNGTLIIAGGGAFFAGSQWNTFAINGTGVISVQTNGLFGEADNEVSGGSIQVASASSATVTVSIDGGTWQEPGILNNTIIGQAGLGTLTVNSGLVDIHSTNGIIMANTAITSEGWINLNGGIISTPFITKGSGYSALFNFNGGTLKATENQSAFLQGLDQVNVLTNGAFIDSSNFSVEIDLPLLSGSSPDGGLTKLGAGILTLGGANTYTGNTTVSNGTLALSGSGSIGDSTNIIIAGGATFDVSALSSSFALVSGQTLSNINSTAVLNGGADASLGGISLTYASGTPSLTVANGTLTLASNTVFNVNNTGSPLTTGSYNIISVGTGGSVAVSDSLPSVTVSGSGIAFGATAALQTNSSELYLVVSGGTPPMPRITGISLSGTTLNIAATNGAANGAWSLLQSTNVALPLSQWQTNCTGTFDSNGNLSTNILNTATNSQEFYILKQ